MFAGPIIAREVVTGPRSPRYFLWRASFACFLFLVMWTAWQAIIGWREVREFGLMARFGGVLYYMFALIQLTLMLFVAPVFTAASIAHEKDRRTFILLMMTDLSDLEIVLGKLLTGLMNILGALIAATGLLALCTLYGGISFGQVFTLFAVTASSAVAGGAMGMLVALWRDRSFQSISLTIMMVVFSVAGVEAFARAFPTLTLMGVPLVEVLNPYRAIFAVLYPQSENLGGFVATSSLVYILVRLGAAARLLVLFGRADASACWNPGRNEPRERGEEAGAVETLIEVDEAEALAPVAVGRGRGASPWPPVMQPAGSPPHSGRTRRKRHPSRSLRRGRPHDGLHVPCRTHRRIVRGQERTASPGLTRSSGAR
ncbi:MAG: ABC transporter permease [Isosphaeraceae bacterium]